MDNTNSGFDMQQTKRLFELCSKAVKSGKSLRVAFETMAIETGRKPNSIRNYYYSHLKTLNMIPELSKKLGITPVQAQTAGFELFERDEVEKLIRSVLTRRANGESVRAVTMDMSGGDKSKMLRLQNKYRSVVFSRRRLAEEIMRKMRDEKLTFYDPYTRTIVRDGVEASLSGDTLLDNIKAIARDLGDEQVTALFAGLARLAYLSVKNLRPDAGAQRKDNIKSLSEYVSGLNEKRKMKNE